MGELGDLSESGELGNLGESGELGELGTLGKLANAIHLWLSDESLTCLTAKKTRNARYFEKEQFATLPSLARFSTARKLVFLHQPSETRWQDVVAWQTTSRGRNHKLTKGKASTYNLA